jgi:hypothetical protein
MLANLAIVVTATRWLLARRYITIKLRVGSVKIRKCDLDVSNLTNIVSKEFYKGGRIDEDVRTEIIRATLPGYSVNSAEVKVDETED